MTGLIIEINNLLIMVVMLFNMCNSNEFNRQACMSDWDQWLIPELIRAWEIKTGQEIPYQNEQDVLE